MKTIIIVYLFCKAMVNAEFSIFDCSLAWDLMIWENPNPSFIGVIKGGFFGSPIYLPEARADIVFSIKEWFGGLWHR